MERIQRFLLFLAAVLASAPLFIKGRAAIPRNGGAPFLPFSTSGIKVRLGGAVASPGVYVFAPGSDLADVIKLTSMTSSAVIGDGRFSPSPLVTGSSLEIPRAVTEHAEIAIQMMHTREKLLLGIPLDPDQMDREDWCVLPGIGPNLAERIVCDRQRYGAFRSAESLMRVPGIGEKTYARLRKYFAAM
jgi:competence protein ComEA